MTNQAGTLSQPRWSGVRASLRRPWLPASLLVLMVIGYTLLVFTFLRPHNAIANLDFWYHIELGRRLDMAQPATLTDGLYPLGYPAILRFAVQNHVDALRVGQALAWLGGLLSLVGLFVLSYRITREPFLALGGAVLLITNLRFLSTAGYEGNDLLAGGLQVIALWLAWEIADHGEWRACFSFALAAGVVAGLAYLVRYTALIMLPILLLLAILQRRGLWRRGLVLGGVLLAAFLLTTLVQTIPSALVHGNPFYNTQAKNVWFGIYGQRDWVNNWGKVWDSISLGEVLALGPRAFVTHWWREFLRFFWEMPLWTRFWHIAWITGGLFLLFYRRLPLVRRLLLLAALLVPTAVTAMAWLDPRFLLVPLVMQALIIVLLLDGGLSLTPSRTRLAVYLVLAAAFVACMQPDCPRRARMGTTARQRQRGAREPPASRGWHDGSGAGGNKRSVPSRGRRAGPHPLRAGLLGGLCPAQRGGVA